MIKHKLKVGDIVSFDYIDSKTYRGKVIELDSPEARKGAVTVSFGNDFFHGWEDIYEHCWYCDESELKLVSRKGKEKHTDKSKEIKIIVNEPAVIAIRGDKKGVAKCNPADTFDVAIGVNLAVERLKAQEKFIPKEHERFYFIRREFKQVLDSSYCSTLDEDAIFVAMGNCFRTEKEAETNRNKIKARFDKLLAYAKELADSD